MNSVSCSFSDSYDHVWAMSRIPFPASLLVNSYKETRDTLGFSWAKKHRKVGAHLVLLCLTDAMFSTNWRQDFPSAKRLQLALFQYSLYCGALEMNLQYLWDTPIFCHWEVGSEGEHNRKKWGSIEHGGMRFQEWWGNHVYLFYGIYLGLLHTRE